MMTTNYAELPSIALAYRQHGAGANLILLHGNSESKSLFKRYQTRVFPDFRTFAIDSRGHGQSRSEDDAYSIEGYADDVIAFCEKLGIDRAAVIGFSDGGNVALWLGRKKPEVFTDIVAVSPNYLASGLTDGTFALIRTMRRLFSFLALVGFPTHRLVMKMDLMLKDIGLSSNDLRTIRSRVRILYAKRDMIREEHILEIGAAIPNATVGKIAGATHLSIMGKQATRAEMRAFLGTPAKTVAPT